VGREQETQVAAGEITRLSHGGGPIAPVRDEARESNWREDSGTGECASLGNETGFSSPKGILHTKKSDLARLGQVRAEKSPEKGTGKSVTSGVRKAVEQERTRRAAFRGVEASPRKGTKRCCENTHPAKQFLGGGKTGGAQQKGDEKKGETGGIHKQRRRRKKRGKNEASSGGRGGRRPRGSCQCLGGGSASPSRFVLGWETWTPLTGETAASSQGNGERPGIVSSPRSGRTSGSSKGGGVLAQKTREQYVGGGGCRQAKHYFKFSSNKKLGLS